MSKKRETRPVDPPTTDGLPRPRRTSLKLRRRNQDGMWELVHPPCALERADDLEEVEQMIGVGEVEVAQDELRWLLDGCSDFVTAHRLLGELAIAAGDLPLARGHFGYAFEIGLGALPADFAGGLPYRIPANQAFFEAAKGLAHCLRELDRTTMALAVVRKMLALDPTDPLGVGAWGE